ATWDPNGDHLYFISAREFAPQISQSEFNFATNRMSQIYALALRNDTKHPFPYEDDQVTILVDRPDPSGSPTPTPTPTPTPSTTPVKAERIDFDGIVDRAVKVPLPADNYAGLSANKGHLVYVISPPFYYGRGPGVQASLRVFSMKDRQETSLQQPVSGYALSSDGTKLLAGTGGSGYTLIDANPGGERTKKTVSVSGLVTEIDPAQEW